VNSKTLVKFFSVVILGVALAGRASAHDEIGTPVPLGNSTFSITCTGGSAFMRDIDQLKAEASDSASKFCEAQGKVLKPISMKEKKPRFSFGYFEATLVFMALNPGDPALLPPSAPVAASAGMPEAAPAPRTLSTDELVDELTKLDDLRKKGILTDDEFQAEKKKVLSHSN
jgi:hypothetical protein